MVLRGVGRAAHPEGHVRDVRRVPTAAVLVSAGVEPVSQGLAAVARAGRRVPHCYSLKILESRVVK